jgi:PiT family inorganic phosphate transporter
MHSDALLVIVIAAALTFDFTNGFHDTANVVASQISTRALSPRTAVAIASVLNFAGAFISLKVAATIGTGIIRSGQVTETIAFAGLVGAISWNLITWFYGLPSSSSHALIGGVMGALLAAVGGDGIRWHGVIFKVILPGLIAPASALLIAAVLIVVIYRLVGRRRPGSVTKAFRFGQMVSSSALSLAHGTNDAQKTMGVIALALVAHGDRNFHVPTWVVIAAASAIGLGTYAGGWRIIRTVGSRMIIKMDSAQGFSAQGAGAAVILVSSHLGYPLSSTQVISGGVIGAGVAKRVSAVRWGIAGNIAAAWALTLPAAGLLGALAYWLAAAFGSGALGPLLISVIAIGAFAYRVSLRRGPLAPTTRIEPAPGAGAGTSTGTGAVRG